jgi:phosphoglucosamine mutase
LCELVKREKLDAGFAFDGDADRCIAVDENGAVVTGDHILYLLAVRMKKDGELVNNTVVTTVMSNLGLYRALREKGIEYVQTTVGDRYVYENMQKTKNCIGGEQSGHIILSKYATTGDGILTAIKIMETVIREKLPLSRLSSPVEMLPQITRNVPVADKDAACSRHEVKETLASLSASLGDRGRILLRKSGTEPLLRVMVEAPTVEECEAYAEALAERIRAGECMRSGGGEEWSN